MFLEALAAGALLGMLYDLCRVLRERWRRRAAAALLDFGFWITVCGTLFLFAILRGDGQVRLYHGVAFAAGAGVYFVTLSRIALKIFRILGDGCAFLWRLLTTPLRKAGTLAKKVLKKQKKDFQIWLEWYRINMIHHPTGQVEKGAGGREAKAGRHRHKIRHLGAAGSVG